jgi:hypothetical protein
MPAIEDVDCADGQRAKNETPDASRRVFAFEATSLRGSEVVVPVLPY